MFVSKETEINATKIIFLAEINVDENGFVYEMYAIIDNGIKIYCFVSNVTGDILFYDVVLLTLKIRKILHEVFKRESNHTFFLLHKLF